MDSAILEPSRSSGVKSMRPQAKKSAGTDCKGFSQ